jgi:hypothetical protein
MPFTTDNSAPGFTLDDFKFILSGTIASPNFAVYVYTSTGSFPAATPGVSLGTGSGQTDPGIQTYYTYSFSGVTLQPNTMYWVVMQLLPSPPATGFYDWFDSPISSNIGSWSVGEAGINSYASPYGGNASPYGGTGWFPNSPLYPVIAVVATPVPEPAACAVLLGLPALALACFRRRPVKIKA